jgi:hypothetical protein
MTIEFYEGQKVVCVSQDFPLIKKYGGTGKEAQSTPKKNEILIINEILGDFLRFDKYDTEDSNNWWFYNHFAPIDETEISIENLLLESIYQF